MTEAEWLACTDPERMLAFLQGKASDRKVRLFACACCRSFWHLVEDQRSQKAVEVAERYADGVATKEEVASARRELKADYRNKHRAAIAKSVSEQSAAGWALGWDMARYTLRANSPDAARLGILGFAAGCRSGLVADSGRKNCPVEWLHDIFGLLPFRQVSIRSDWLAPNVMAIAQTIYEERRFQDMPILADALEEGGCDNADILAHCRRPGPHTRGCWPLDLLLEKE